MSQLSYNLVFFEDDEGEEFFFTGGEEMRRRSEEKEVEELLKAAEDEMLLKFSVNSHTTHSNLDSELVRRFEALKSPSIKMESSSNSVIRPKRKEEGEKKKDVDELEDLSTRFEALKGTRASSSTVEIPGRSENEEEEEDDEVAKVIQWAMDAARLDPSKSDDEDVEDDDDYDDDDDDDDRKRKPKK